MTNELIDTTSQLGQVGTDVSGFLTGITPGIVGMGLIFGIVIALVLVIIIMFDKDVIGLEHEVLKTK